MTQRQVLEALSGLLLGMFVSILAGTVVSTSLPVIISDLRGDQSAYTWVVTSTLLATTVSTPLWGKFADLFDRKRLIQLALVIFVLGSTLAGFAQNTDTLIAFRMLQGLGAGGLVALSQIIMADIISPRDRGRYAGLFGAVMALGTVGGPLLGGVVTDSVGWRWNFFIALPVAIAAILLLQRTLHLPRHPKRRVRIDYFGAALIAGGISLLLIWVSLARTQFEWVSAPSFTMFVGAIVLLVAAVAVELKVPEPIIPLGMFRNRTFSLSVVASLAVGVSMFGTSVFLAQYMQLARGATPTGSGLLTIPMMGGLLVSSTLFGNLISRFGRWKAIMVSGAVLVVTFFRSLGGTVGVSALGAALGTIVAQRIRDGLPSLTVVDQLTAVETLGTGTIPQVSALPGAIRVLVESTYGVGVGSVFLFTVPLALLTLLAVSLLTNSPLGTKNAVQLRSGTDDRRRAGEDAEDSLIATSAATAALRPVGQVHPTGPIDIVDIRVEDSVADLDDDSVNELDSDSADASPRRA
ncbi:MAG: MFS transporter [Burkholderiaceae bacterium]|nr:MFS transporter [Microbacteriaceae bacterium]